MTDKNDIHLKKLKDGTIGARFFNETTHFLKGALNPNRNLSRQASTGNEQMSQLINQLTVTYWKRAHVFTYGNQSGAWILSY